MMRSLISVADIFSEKDPTKRVALEEKIDDILSRGERDVDLASSGGDETNDPDGDHVYHDTTVDDYALEVFAGYVARKLRKNSCARKCHDCFLSLTKSEDEPALETQYLIEKRSQGHRLTSSRPLFKLLKDLEGRIVNVLGSNQVGRHLLLRGTLPTLLVIHTPKEIILIELSHLQWLMDWTTSMYTPNWDVVSMLTPSPRPQLHFMLTPE